MAIEDAGHIDDHAKVSFFNNPKVRSVIYQVLLVGAVVWLIWSIKENVSGNLERQNIATGWGFLSKTSGFDINQHLISYSETSTYGRAIMVGFLNTLLIASIGVVLATILGFGNGHCATFQ